MNRKCNILYLAVIIFAFNNACLNAENVKIATYNIEHFARMFDQHKLPRGERDMTEYYRDCEDIYEVARVINLPDFDPDIICIEEGPELAMLELFNKDYLNSKYAFVRVFDTNSNRDQTLAMLAKPGFVVKQIVQYCKDPDPADSSGTKWLFSRGPGFVQFQTPGGNQLCVGVTHIKSKYGDNPDMVKRRGRQMARIGAICASYIDSGLDYVAVLGDFNDSFGLDKNETKAGMDAIAQVLAASDRITCLTRPLQQQGDYTYHCQFKSPRYRSFLDHIFVSESLAKINSSIKVIKDPIADVASDHWPVLANFDFPESSK